MKLNKKKIELNRKVLYVFILILVIRTIYAISYKGQGVFGDSKTYINYNFELLFNLYLTDRVPIYPLILKIGGAECNLCIIFIMQFIISYISVYFFYKTTSLLCNNELLNLGITFLYGSSSMIFGWDNAILTESLALSGTVIFLFYMVKYLKTDRDLYCIIANVLLLILIFLRPTFLLFNAILFCFLMLRMILKKQLLLKPICVCLFSWVIVIIYAGIFCSIHGIFTISAAMPRQLMVVCIERDYYINHPNSEFVELVEEGLEAGEKSKQVWPTMRLVLNKYGQKESQEIAKECIINNLKQYCKDEAELTMQLLASDFNNYAVYKDSAKPLIKVIDNFFNNIKPIHTIVLGVITIMLTIFDVLFRKKFDWLMCGFGVFILGIFISTMMATCGEFMRTMIHIVPFTYLAIIYLLGRGIYKNETFIEKF